jgi:hypothetical protein
MDTKQHEWPCLYQPLNGQNNVVLDNNAIEETAQRMMDADPELMPEWIPTKRRFSPNSLRQLKLLEGDKTPLHSTHVSLPAYLPLDVEGCPDRFEHQLIEIYDSAAYILLKLLASNEKMNRPTCYYRRLRCWVTQSKKRKSAWQLHIRIYITHPFIPQ